MRFVSFTVLYGLRSFVCLSGQGRERSTSDRDCTGFWAWLGVFFRGRLGLGLGLGAMCEGSDVKDHPSGCST
jgi:hypothetical protein